MSKYTDASGRNRGETERLQLSARVRRLQRQKAALEAGNRRLKTENAAKDRRIERLQAEVARLQAALAASERAGKRQAAPFSKGRPRAHPRRPGRKPGAAYGRKGHRPRPPHIDEHYRAKLPARCPHCHGRIRQQSVQLQFQVEIPRRPIYRQFTIPVGECVTCGARIQGRHPLQTSDALGAAAVQLGPPRAIREPSCMTAMPRITADFHMLTINSASTI